MVVDPILGLLAGMILGTKPMPREVIRDLRSLKPQFYWPLAVDMATARTNQEKLFEGNFISVDRVFTAGKLYLRLNERDNPLIDLTRMKSVQGPFYRFFLTNEAGTGGIDLMISRGYAFRTDPIEAIDTAELAVRLGSIVSFDRRGEIVFMDDFEGPKVHWRQQGVGPGGLGSWEISQDTARSGAQSIFLETGTDIGARRDMWKIIPRPVPGKIGFEISVTGGSNTSRILQMKHYDGTMLLEAKVKLDGLAETLSYWSSAGAWEVFATGIALSYHSYFFSTCKLVADIATRKYVRFLLNAIEYDLSSYDLEATANSTNPQLLIMSTSANAYGGGAQGDYWDDAIVTQNEP